MSVVYIVHDSFIYQVNKFSSSRREISLRDDATVADPDFCEPLPLFVKWIVKSFSRMKLYEIKRATIQSKLKENRIQQGGEF